MGRAERLTLIKQIEDKRNSKVVVYITGDRRGLETRIATDVFPFVLEHLENIGNTNQIDFFIYTPGGVAMAATGLVALLREFCNKLCVIIPFKAHSAGTLIALGADSIVMSKVAQLSPVDPSVNSPYNPPAPGPQPPGAVNFLPVNVEDVIGYLSLAREEAGIKDDDAMANVFKDLSSKVHPLALGSVYRARAQMKMVASQLLARHMGKEKEKQVKEIADKLTHELYSHDYIIGRKEATENLKLNIENIDAEMEIIIWQLYKEYEDLMQLTTPLNAASLLAEADQQKFTFTRAVIESQLRIDAFQSEQEFRKSQVTLPGAPAPVIGYQNQTIYEQWTKNAQI